MPNKEHRLLVVVHNRNIRVCNNNRSCFMFSFVNIYYVSTSSTSFNPLLLTTRTNSFGLNPLLLTSSLSLSVHPLLSFPLGLFDSIQYLRLTDSVRVFKVLIHKLPQDLMTNCLLLEDDGTIRSFRLPYTFVNLLPIGLGIGPCQIPGFDICHGTIMIGKGFDVKNLFQVRQDRD